jgi:hypothetical protein
VSWRAGPRALLNVVLFDLAVLIGAWVVHSTEYRIEFGRNYDAVMATTDHRYYMAAGGWILGVALLCSVLFGLVIAHRGAKRVQTALALLSPRLASRADRMVAPRAARIGLPLISLFICQVAFYVVQENLEAWSMGRALPGLLVLVAPQHITVLPLHALVAWCSAVLLTLAGVRLQRRRSVARLAAALGRLLRGNGPRRVAASPDLQNPLHAVFFGARVAQRGPPASA